MKEYGMFTINEMVEFLTYHNINTINTNIYDSFKTICNQHNLMITDIVADIRRAREDAIYEICKRVGCDWADIISEDFGLAEEDEVEEETTFMCDCCGGSWVMDTRREHDILGFVCEDCYWENTCVGCGKEFEFTHEGNGSGCGDFYCDECWKIYNED